MKPSWAREAQRDQATDRILDAAEKAFIELGVPATGMAQVAEYAGCSRGTLYRYFRNRHELHLAFVNRAALEILRGMQGRLGAVTDPRERLVESILLSVAAVRENPGTAAWFEPGVSELAARMSRSSELVDTLTTTFVSELVGPDSDDPESRLRARWLVRIIISLLSMPGQDEAEERALVERFVAPVLLSPAGG